MNSQKIMTIIAAVVGLIGVILLGRIIGVGDEAIESGESAGVVAPFMTLAYIVFFIALAAVVIFTLKNIFSNPAVLKSTLKSVVAFGVLAAIAYAMASGVETEMKDGEMLSAGGSKLVGAGLYLFYFLAIIAAGAMLFTGVKKMINK